MRPINFHLKLLSLVVAGVAAAATFGAATMLHPNVTPTADENAFRLARSYVRQLGDGDLVAVGHERSIKAALAENSSGRCFVVGSSRIMTLSKASLAGIEPNCETIVNLGVSGGSLEDHVAFAGLTAGARATFFGIDHWTYRYGADERFAEILPAYRDARCRFGIGACLPRQGILRSMRHAFFRSKMNGVKDDISFRPASARSHTEAITQSDGSHVYSERYLIEMRDKWDPAHLRYKLTLPAVSTDAETDFKNVMKSLVDAGTKVYLVHVPYHPRATSCEDTELCSALRESEAASRRIAREAGMFSCGSYFSAAQPTDFISDMFIEPSRLKLSRENCK